MPIFDQESIRRQVDRAAQEQEQSAQVDVSADLAGGTVTTEVAAEKSFFGSKLLGSLWARWTARAGPDDAAVGVRGKWFFGRKEK